MRPEFYSDIDVRGARQDGFYPECALIMPRVIKPLHDFFFKNPDTFAVDLPLLNSGKQRQLGSKIRVFSNDADRLDELMTTMTENTYLDAHCRFSRHVLTVPQEPSRWVTLHRFRISKRNNMAQRKKDLEKVSELPFIMSRSSQNRQVYPLIIQRNIHTGAPEYGIPNSYGLSGIHSVCLPLLSDSDL